MKKDELKVIIKDMKDFIKTGELKDDSLIIIGTNGEYQYLSELHVEGLEKKIGINEIEVAIFQGGYSRGIYLKNGLNSMRKVRALNLA